MKSIIAFCVLVGGLGVWVGWYEDHHPSYCADEVQLKEILALEFRDAKVLLEDGRIVTVNQATLKPGDKFCRHYERK